ncbi:MAG: nitrate ABC transporter substrate-binding protein, partial [Burkholderiaceae bacterium]|nr:nitrate ABC transporter substrate-binding protein [Burkholderiaceae bacterium]
MKQGKHIGASARALLLGGLLGLVSGLGPAAEPLKVIRIGVATGGVGSDPVRHGGTITALAYTEGAVEQE